MGAPAYAAERSKRVPFVAGGVVDKASRGAKAIAARLDQRRELVRVSKIRLQCHRVGTQVLDLFNQGCGIRRGAIEVNADPPGAIRKMQRNGASQPLCRAGHEHGPGFWWLSHVLCEETALGIPSVKAILWSAATLGDAFLSNKTAGHGLNYVERAPCQLTDSTWPSAFASSLGICCNSKQ